ncbi:hypothetical protein QSI_0320 [Clostridioides difficile P28]|nr:hypothetical protein QSI_0320 [Clostridioides difficile P28]
MVSALMLCFLCNKNSIAEKSCFLYSRTGKRSIMKATDKEEEANI